VKNDGFQIAFAQADPLGRIDLEQPLACHHRRNHPQ